MKLYLVGALALLSVSAFAQESAVQVCQKISNYSSSSGTKCAEIISRNQFDPGVLLVASELATNGSTSEAVKVMEIGAGKYMDDNAATVCRVVGKYSASSARSCVEASVDRSFDLNLISIALKIAESGVTSSAVTAITNAQNAFASPGAADVCVVVAQYSGSSGANCVTAIANKEYFNGAEQVCMTQARNGSTSSAVTCLQNSGIVTQRRPGRRGQGNGQIGQKPGSVVSAKDLQDLERGIRKARALYERNQIRQLGDVLIDLDRKIDEIKSAN
jgi:hypothetical protein